MNNRANLRRILNEVKQIRENASDDQSMFILNTVNNDYYNWEAIIYGPSESLYENCEFKLNIRLQDNYPITPLSIKFVTKIPHVNVNENGEICMDILKQEWRSSHNIRTVLLSLISLLSDPNPNDPLNKNLAKLYFDDKDKYQKYIKEICHKFTKKQSSS
jgi:ubiquitin-conjugating enzyme E2 D